MTGPLPSYPGIQGSSCSVAVRHGICSNNIYEFTIRLKWLGQQVVLVSTLNKIDYHIRLAIRGQERRGRREERRGRREKRRGNFHSLPMYTLVEVRVSIR
jgi:hypothetical protein